MPVSRVSPVVLESRFPVSEKKVFCFRFNGLYSEKLCLVCYFTRFHVKLSSLLMFTMYLVPLIDAGFLLYYSIHAVYFLRHYLIDKPVTTRSQFCSPTKGRQNF